eukprot:9147249-Alexandrium_andersonii.AAC.1
MSHSGCGLSSRRRPRSAGATSAMTLASSTWAVTRPPWTGLRSGSETTRNGWASGRRTRPKGRGPWASG